MKIIITPDFCDQLKSSKLNFKLTHLYLYLMHLQVQHQSQSYTQGKKSQRTRTKKNSDSYCRRQQMFFHQPATNKTFNSNKNHKQKSQNFNNQPVQSIQVLQIQVHPHEHNIPNDLLTENLCK